MEVNKKAHEELSRKFDWAIRSTLPMEQMQKLAARKWCSVMAFRVLERYRKGSLTDL